MSDLVAALAAAQAEFPTIPKNHTNPHFKSRYADLSDVLAAVRPVLAKHGIALVQPLRWTDAGLELVTALLKGDERLESSMPLPVDAKPQDLGSRLTYLRRYSLCALLGVAAEDDDDGNAAQAAEPKYRSDGSQADYRPVQRATPQQMDARPATTVGGPARPLTENQKKKISELAGEVRRSYGWSVAEMAEVYLAAVGKDGADVMSNREASTVIDLLFGFKEKKKHAEFDEDGKAHIVDTATTEAF